MSNFPKLSTILHLHIIGFWHEQSRYDRDEFIRINWDNMELKGLGQFGMRKMNSSETFEIDLISRTSYDYCSLMHYSAHAYAKVSHYFRYFSSYKYYTHILFFVGNGTNYRGLEETRMYGDGTTETFFQARLEENQLVVQM